MHSIRIFVPFLCGSFVKFGDEKDMFLDVNSLTQIKQSLDKNQRKELLYGMMLTRACDNALKRMFLSGDICYKQQAFAGKGFRSLGQEAIYGAGYLLNRGASAVQDANYIGDIAGPLIRDLGVFLCFTDNKITSVLNAQAAKSGEPCDGRDLHAGAFSLGVLTPAAPLAISACTLVGIALAFKLKKERRVALSFIGEGGTSLGEWHEAINFAAVHALPMIFCVQNNQTALSTQVSQQSKAQKFADKALGYGIKSLTIDGNDVELIAATFKLAADYTRAGFGPVLLELETMRMCGHAHHDDMLYLGHDPKLSLELPQAQASGYANVENYNLWRERDPILLYKNKLINTRVISHEEGERLWERAEQEVSEAYKEVKNQQWPEISLQDHEVVYKNPIVYNTQEKTNNYIFDTTNSKSKTYLQAIAESFSRAFKKYPNCYVIGEDVAAPYGNAFMLFKSLLNNYPERLINTPISENAIVGACVGMALMGMRPVGEMQFNDFVACAMNQVVNNAAKIFYRWKASVPMVLRMPYGGLRRAGPYHSQDTSAWFYRVAGLKIMAPSTPIDAFFMLQQAIADADPVLFYEHIALYRDPTLRQVIPEHAGISGASVIKPGTHLTIISYGAYVHKAYKAACELEKNYNILAEIIDLRYLKPFDLPTCYTSIAKTSRVLLVGEDSLDGTILQYLASYIADDMFAYLDAPVRVLGSRNTPVPYSPALEDDYLLSQERIITEALKLIAF
jgi:2-oxoisovalerate dehydrogenase E1 component